MKKSIKNFTLVSILLLAIFILTGCSTGIDKTTKFEKPDIKDDFCGPVMNYQYCKCAFHNEFCDSIGMSSGAADSYVRDEYNKWLKEKREAFGSICELDGAIYNGSETCTYCKDGYYKDDNKCVETENGEEEEDDSDYIVFRPDGPFNADCSINESEFDDTWQKYSDFDNLIEIGSRSWEVQQNIKTYEKMIGLMARNFKLERDMEIDRQSRLALREYKVALVKNIKANLLKAMTRLAYITYSTVKNGIGTGQSYTKIFTGDKVVEKIGAGLKVFQAGIPKDPELNIDTSTFAGKVASIGLNGALEAIESMGNPKDIVVKMVTDSRNAALMSPDITPEEIAILHDQHIDNKLIDEVLKQSYRDNAIRRMELLDNRQWIEVLEVEAASWEAKEKIRVRSILESSCREEKDRFENQETSLLDLFINRARAMDTSAQQYELGGYKIDYDTNEGDNYYLADKLILSVYDIDDDGRYDMWLEYDDELYVVFEAYDTTGDGNSDTFVELDREEAVTNLVQPELEMPEIEEVVDNSLRKVTKDIDIVVDQEEENSNSKRIFTIIIISGFGFFIYTKKFKKRLNK